MSKKIVIFLAALGLLLTGCGHDDPADELETVSESSSEETETEEISAEEETTEEDSEEITEEETTEEDSEEITEEETTEEDSEEITEEETSEEDVSAENETEDISDEFYETFDSEQTDPAPDEFSENNIIPELRLGMTQDEVFEIIPDGSDYKYTQDLPRTSVYCYNAEFPDIDMDAYRFVEFDEKSGKLINYGWHLGQQGTYEEPVFPYTEEQLHSAYASILKMLLEWYGEGEYYDRYADSGIKSEYVWETEYGEIWAVYGVNMWAWDGEPDSYENGLNEIVVSCSVPYDERIKNY